MEYGLEDRRGVSRDVTARTRGKDADAWLSKKITQIPDGIRMIKVQNSRT